MNRKMWRLARGGRARRPAISLGRVGDIGIMR
jgi:hypothetical protein